MGNLVFQATLGGQVNLVGPNTASTFNLNVPAVSSTIASLAAQTFAGTQTFTLDAFISGLTVGKGGGADAEGTAVGYQALNVNSGTNGNAAFGYQALLSNTSGIYNVGIGKQSLKTNTSGTYNSAVGIFSLYYNTTGGNNTAQGYQSLFNNTTASNNTAVGYQAGYTNSVGTFCTYVGNQAAYTATGSYNTIIGSQAGKSLTTGTDNTFIGPGNYAAGYYVTTGSKNTILGGYTGNQGGLDIRTASNNIVLSDGDGNSRAYNSAGSYWYFGTGSAANTTDTTNIYSWGTYNYTSGGSANMGINSSGFMYRSTSSLKYKKNVQDATHGLAELLKLRPVTYESKQESEIGIVYGGLIAEEVHNSGLTEFVQYAQDGTPDALAYGNMVSLCVKAIQELKTIVDAQAAEITALKAKVGI
jgi:hypothetical protein